RLVPLGIGPPIRGRREDVAMVPIGLYVNNMAPLDKDNSIRPAPAVPDSPELRAWVQLVRAYQRVVRRLEQALGDPGLSLAQCEVLAHVHFGAGISQSELAQRLLVTKGNVCGLIDRLGAAGLVVRRADPDDRRANRLSLTPRGAALLAGTLPTHLA